MPPRVKIEEFVVKGNGCHGMRGEMARYQNLVNAGEFDIVMSYAAQQWTTDALLEIVATLTVPTVVAPCGFSALYNRRYADYFALLPSRLRHVDSLVFHSTTYRDIAFARHAGLDQLVTIPNGADAREFGDATGRGARFRRRYGIPPDRPLILTVGSHTGHKGHATLLRVLRQLPFDATLVLIGNSAGLGGCHLSCRARASVAQYLPRRNQRVLLLDPPRDEVIDAYFAADLFVFASEVECSPLVLFEAAAAGLPVITVPVGNAAEIIEWTGGGMVVGGHAASEGMLKPRVAPLAAAVSELLGDVTRRATLSLSARVAWQETYTWARIARRYEELYLELAGRH